ncbi:hypothetical protein REPUB_Repub10bG0113800 [Reevesia pubescens]
MNHKELSYVGGGEVRQKCQPDKISYSLVLKIIGELGYSHEAYIYFRIPRDNLGDGLVLLHNENTSKNLKGYVFEHCFVELYIDHQVDVPNDGFGVGEDVVVDEFNDGLDVVCDVGGNKLNKEDEHEVFLIDVACLSDNDDDEIEAIREKVKNFKERKYKEIDEVDDLEIPVNIRHANSLTDGFSIDESEGQRVNEEVGEARVNESTSQCQRVNGFEVR